MHENPSITSIRKFVRRLMDYSLFRAISSVPIALGNLLRKEKLRYRQDQVNGGRKNAFDKALKGELVVRQGPFSGLKYPYYTEKYTILPKLVGSYEEELNDVIEEVCDRGDTYTSILNIGSADGYYSAGFSQRIPGTKVYSFDVDLIVTEYFKAVMAANGLEDKLIFKGYCSPDYLASFPFEGRAFVLCDCEGFEYELFTEKSVKNLKNCDVLIEVHDHFNPDISASLRARFKDTHDLSVIHSKVRNPEDYPILQGLAPYEKHWAITEKTLSLKWFYFRAKGFSG